MLRAIAVNVLDSISRFRRLRSALSSAALWLAFETFDNIVLIFDEFRRFEKKANIDGATLFPMLNELFDKNDYANLRGCFDAELRQVLALNGDSLASVDDAN